MGSIMEIEPARCREQSRLHAILHAIRARMQQARLQLPPSYMRAASRAERPIITSNCGKINFRPSCSHDAGHCSRRRGRRPGNRCGNAHWPDADDSSAGSKGGRPIPAPDASGCCGGHANRGGGRDNDGPAGVCSECGHASGCHASGGPADGIHGKPARRGRKRKVAED